MSVIDTKLNNLNIWEGTTAQVEGAYEQELIGENDLVFITDETPEGSFEDKFRYSTMPFASEEWAGKIVQYIGGTNDTYVEGGFYKCANYASHIDEATYSVLSGQTVAITDISKYNDKVAWYKSYDHEFDYIVISQYPTQPETAYYYIRMYKNDGTLDNTESGPFSSLTRDWGITVSGPQYFNDTVYVKVINEFFGWKLLQNDTVIDAVAFSHILGDPHDNTALDTELTRIENASAIQVSQLPVISEDTKDKIYQYVGNDNPSEGLFKGSFYGTKGAQWEYDVENSHLVDDIQFEVFDESKFLSFLVNAILTTYPTATYFDFCFDDGASTSPIRLDVYLDPSISAERYWRDNAMNLGYYAGAVIRGTPTRTSDKTTCTRLRINISTIDSYEHWTWIPVSLYPEPKANKVSLYNISVNNTSLIEHSCHYQLSANSANTVLIGVNARNDYYTDVGHQTAVGYNAHVSAFGTAIGCNASAYSNAIAIGTNARTNGESCIVIGTNNEADEHSLVIGPSCETRAEYSSAIGYDSEVQSNGEKAVALGYKAIANAEGAIQLGEGTNSSANTLKFKNYVLLDSSGVIPTTRLSAYSPEDGYVLTFDGNSGVATWTSVIPDIPATQETIMPQATEGRTVQYIGESDGTYVEGYFYKATYNSQDDVYYWRQIDTQPSGGTISYDSLDDKPSISGVTIEGDLDLVEDFGLARVATTGSYADLTTKPGINGHPLLTNTSAAELEISYDDLIDKPANLLPNLPQDADQYDYMLKWDHTAGELVWFRATDTEEDLGTLPEPTNN